MELRVVGVSHHVEYSFLVGIGVGIGKHLVGEVTRCEMTITPNCGIVLAWYFAKITWSFDCSHWHVQPDNIFCLFVANFLFPV